MIDSWSSSARSPASPVIMVAAPRRVPRPTAATAVRGGAQVVTAVRDSAQVSAILAAGCPGMFDDRRYALGLLSLVLGGGMSSRLFVEVRERRGLAYSIEAGESVYSDAGLFSIDWQCAPERLTDILDVVRQVTGELAEIGHRRAGARAGQDPAARPDHPRLRGTQLAG